jgi:lipid A 3-O-deacylase
LRKLSIALCAGLAIAALPASASAAEVFGGLYAHNVDTPLTLGGHVENGVDLQLGLRGSSIARVIGADLQPYAFGALNTAGNTSYAAVGLSAKFGGQIYIRPGLGIAIHNGSAADFENPNNDKIEFGSRVLFEPELGIGVQVAPRITAEASWIHLSHAQIFGKQNPGMDNIGVRLNVGF